MDKKVRLQITDVIDSVNTNNSIEDGTLFKLVSPFLLELV